VSVGVGVAAGSMGCCIDRMMQRASSAPTAITTPRIFVQRCLHTVSLHQPLIEGRLLPSSGESPKLAGARPQSVCDSRCSIAHSSRGVKHRFQSMDMWTLREQRPEARLSRARRQSTSRHEIHKRRPPRSRFSPFSCLSWSKPFRTGTG
jgi:hypothetical protein